MALIGITQRVDVVEEHGERRDALDQNWTLLLKDIGITVLPLPNHLSIECLGSLDFKGFLLSGGNDLVDSPYPSNIALERDMFETAVLDYAIQNELPVLGVCRGFQMINAYYGGHLRPIDNHIATNHAIRPAANCRTLFIDKITVNSYHGYGIALSDLATGLIPCAFAKDDTVEAAMHEHLPHYGVMWHPERTRPWAKIDLDLIKSLFLEECQ